MAHKPCPRCGNAMDAVSQQCAACFAATRKRVSAELKKQRKRGYYAKYRNKNRERYRIYMQERRARVRVAAGILESPYDTCACGGRKLRANEACMRCRAAASAERARQARLQPVKLFRPCWVCGVSMRPMTWHGKKFLRCPKCGLEVKKPGLYASEEAA